jgi:Bacterial Ig domain
MKRALILLAVAVAALSGGVARSRATFVAASSNPVNAFNTSPVFNGVSVSLSDPGTPLRTSVPLAATATSDRALVSVTIQRSPAGAGTWTTICAPTAAPYGCSWSTGGVTDGLYDLRAVALDASGYSKTATVSSRRVDNTAPSTTNTTAGPLTGSATVSATATDAGSGVLSVAFDYKPSAGSTWTAICTKAAAPYSCAWSTAALTDGDYDIRASTTDNAGNTSSSTVTRRADNTAPTITMADPGAMTTGETLSATTGDGAGTGVASVTYQYRANGSSGAWSTACTAAATPFSCTFATLPADGLYDLRAIATDGAGLTTTSAAITARRVDTVIPSAAAITDPGSPLRGSVTLNGTGADAASGMASMRFEYKTSAGSTWSTACTDTTPPSPFSCAWDTTALTDGSYDVRSVAIDAAGNVRNSTAVTARVVDNTRPVVSVTAPGPFRTSTTVNATATDNVAVQSVAIQYAVSGSGSYTTLCTDTSSPYSCTWNAALLADGAYDVRAIATDTAGNQTTSAVVSAYVNNTGPTGTDVQGTNGGVDDRLDAGDTVIFSYSTTMQASSILAGWNGASAPIKVRVNDGGTSDSMQFYDNANTTPLGLLATGTALAINIDHVTAPTVFNATIAMSGTNITVTIGSLVSGAVTSSPTGKNAMVWQTNAQALSSTGKPTLPTTVTESGASDLDF